MRAKSVKRLKGIKMLKDLDKIEGLTPEQVDKINGLTSGLISKNQELLDKNNGYKQSLSSEESAQEKLNALEASRERESLEQKQNYSGALEIQQSEFNNALEKERTTNSDNAKLIHTLVVENGLQAELANLNVNKDLIPLIMSGLSAQATVVDGKAVIGEVSLSDYMKEWADTPTGKASILAAANSGGDGSGGGSIPTGKKMADLTGEERNTLFRNNPVEFNRLKQEALAKH